MADRELLSDEGMREFIRNGFITFEADMPAGFHENVFERTEKGMETGGNPGNNILAVVPELQQVLDHPRVAGTLGSILGADYDLNAHRYCHRRPLDAEAQSHLHKDGWSQRHHRARWCMAFYYPQDTNLELGPTTVVPGSQYYNREPDSEVGEEIPLCGAAGTVTILHYDLWHRRSEKTGRGQRFMFKFLFARMGEPVSPAWNSQDSGWTETGDRRDPMWKAMWEWSSGSRGNGSSGQGGDAGELAARLADANETTCFQAAYSLAAMGAPAVPELIRCLSSEDEGMRRNAGYGLAAAGPAAVPALEEAARAERPETRAAAVDALGDMGLPAAPAVATLQAALKDEEDEVRTRAACALGNVGVAAEAAIPSLVDALDDPGDWVVRHCLLALAKLGPRAAEVVPGITRYLHHDNRYVRAKAALVLRRAGTKEATDALIDHLATARWCPLTTKDSQY